MTGNMRLFIPEVNFTFQRWHKAIGKQSVTVLSHP